MALTPEERRLRAQIAGRARWSRETDRYGATAAARAAFEQKFHDQVPAAITDPVDRAKAAESLRSEHFARLRFKALRARREAAEANARAAQAARNLADAELDGGDAA